MASPVEVAEEAEKDPKQDVASAESQAKEHSEEEEAASQPMIVPQAVKDIHPDSSNKVQSITAAAIEQKMSGKYLNN